MVAAAAIAGQVSAQADNFNVGEFGASRMTETTRLGKTASRRSPTSTITITLWLRRSNWAARESSSIVLIDELRVLIHRIDDMDTLGAATKGGIQACFSSHRPRHLGATRDQDYLIANTFFLAKLRQFFHPSAVDIVVTDDGRDQDGMGANLDL